MAKYLYLIISICLLIGTIFIVVDEFIEHARSFEFDYQNIPEITTTVFDDTYPDVLAEQIVERYIIDQLVIEAIQDEVPYIYGIMKVPERRSNAIKLIAMRYEKLITQREEIICLATNMYHEARSEGRQGMIAVGWVTLNRVNSELFPDTICDVVYQRNQFAWIFELGASRWNTKVNERAAYEKALDAAQYLYSRQDDAHDYTVGAQYFLSPMPAGLPKPSWSRRFEQTLVYKRHTFYRDNRA